MITKSVVKRFFPINIWNQGHYNYHQYYVTVLKANLKHFSDSLVLVQQASVGKMKNKICKTQLTSKDSIRDKLSTVTNVKKMFLLLLFSQITLILKIDSVQVVTIIF